MKIDLDNHELNLSGLVCNYARLTGDTAEFTLSLDIPAGWSEAAPIPPDIPDGFGYGDYLEFWQDGSKLIAGYISNVKPCAAGKAWDLAISLSSVLSWLYKIPYVPDDDDEQLVDTATAVKAVLAHALANSGLNFAYTVGNLSADKVPAITATTTCGDALQTLLDWCPNARVAMSYSVDSNTILVGGTAEDYNYSLINGELTSEAGAVIGTSKGAESVDISPRYDLQHPCVTVLHGRWSASYGTGMYKPNALIYDMPYESLSTTEDEALGASAVYSLKQMEVVRGVRIPNNISYEANHMLSRDNSSTHVSFWQSIDCPWQVRKAGKNSNLVWGAFHLDPMAGDSAYPLEDPTDPDEESTVPYNYESPANWGFVYLHSSGSFYADVESKYCTPSLKFCRGSAEQNVYCMESADLTGLTREQRDEWLKGTFIYDGVKWRYTTLKLEGIFINRSLKKYYPLTSELASDDADYEDPEEEKEDGSSSSSEIDWADVKSGAEQYYNATRKLYYDGSLSLVYFEGNPAGLISKTLSIAGGWADWADMSSPVTGVCYSPADNSLSITIGVSEIISISEYAERMATTRRLSSRALSSAIASIPEDETEDDLAEDVEAEAEDNGVAAIAASYSCNYNINTDAIQRKPWEVYSEGDEHYINGGQLGSPLGIIDVDPQLISKYSENNKYSVRLALSSRGGYEARVVVTYPPST